MTKSIIKEAEILSKPIHKILKANPNNCGPFCYLIQRDSWKDKDCLCICEKPQNQLMLCMGRKDIRILGAMPISYGGKEKIEKEFKSFPEDEIWEGFTLQIRNDAYDILKIRKDR